MTLQYEPTEPPADATVEDLVLWLRNETLRIAQAISGENVFENHKEPNPRYDKQLVFADGTTWNPGSGRGWYRWNEAGTAWVFVG